MPRRIIRPGLARLGRRLRAWVFRPHGHSEAEEEVSFHLAMRVREYISGGMTPTQALARARDRFGDEAAVVAELERLAGHRDERTRRTELMDELKQDVRYALRQLRRAPGFAAIVILTLAVGIGANSAVFSVVNGVLLRPLPYDDPGSLVGVSTAFPSMDFDRFWLAPPEFYELQEWTQAFESVGAWRTGTRAIQTYDRPIEVTSAIASASLFPTLGVTPIAGRAFLEEEDRIGASPVALISEGLWDRAFGRDPALLGSEIRVGGLTAMLVGILPRDFDVEDAGVDLWMPLNLVQGIDPNDHVNRRGNHFLNAVGRLADGATLETARADLDRLETRWMEEYGDTHPIDPEFHPIQASDFRADLVGDVRPAVLLLMGAVGFVLLIACANAASLLLARSESRSTEIAVRVAMGAGSGRLTRQLLTEGVVIALVAGALGLVFGQMLMGALLGMNPDGVPRSEEIGLDPVVIAFTGIVALVTGILFGLAPIIGASLGRVSSTLKEGGARSTRGFGGARLRRALVVAEVALAVVLLSGAGLMVRSMSELQRVDLGFQADGLLTARVTLPESDYPSPAEAGIFFERVLSEIGAVPGVSGITAVSGLPPVRVLNANDTRFEGVPFTPDGPAHNVDYYTAVEAGYVDVMGMTVVDGRAFEPQDALAQTPVVMVNERLANTFYPGQSPVGRRISTTTAEDGVWYTIVGVVADVKQAGVSADPGTELVFYHPQLRDMGEYFVGMNLVVQTDGDPLSLAPAVERVVQGIDPSLAVADVVTMQDNIQRTLAQPRFLSALLGIFAAIALILAAGGTYAVMSFAVAERTREIGIRMAMGAESSAVRGLLLRQGSALALAGLLLGVAGALTLTRLLASQLYGVGAADLWTFVTVCSILGGVALLASYLPALRASRMDPVAALRTD